MDKIEIYCISSKKYSFLEKLNIFLIGAGAALKNKSFYPYNWLKDNSGKNISKKNKTYGTLTSHYWIWKNRLSLTRNWIAVCHHRRFWVKKNSKIINTKNLSSFLLRNIPKKYSNYDVFLPKKIIFKTLKKSKLIKKGFRNYIRNPSMLFTKTKYNINLHFDIFHGYGILEKAARVLNLEDREDFLNYIKNSNSFYPLQIFISKPSILKLLYKKTFEWIAKCEIVFSNFEFEGYGKERLFDFLAERFFSFFFIKYTKIRILTYKLINLNKNHEL